MRRFAYYIIILTVLISAKAYSQFYFFGRNKVQYEKFNWKIIKTEHFNVYYYNELYEIARIGAKFAEEAYEHYKVKFNNIVTAKIPLIFYNTSLQFQQTNTTPGFIPEGVGGFFEFLKGRVVIPFTGSIKEFKHVIRHELVHVFMTNKIFRILIDHRMPTGQSPPLWFTEGLAEYMSTEFDAQANMVLRDAVINNYFVNLQNIHRIFGSYLMYKEGQSFLEFVEDKYGEYKVRQFIENFWMFPNFNDVIAYTIGKPFEKIDEEWVFYEKQKYYPLLNGNLSLAQYSEKLTSDGFNFSPVNYSNRENNFIYFVGNHDGYSSLFRIQETNGKYSSPEIVIKGEKSEEFESFHLLQSAIDISSNGIVAFVTKSGATDAIHFYSIADDEVIKSLQTAELVSISSPKFSNNANSVVFQAVDTKGFSDIFLYELKNDSLVRLTNDYYDDRDPVFGVNDRQIIFSSDRTSGKYKQKHNLFSFNLDDFSIKYITYLNADNFSPFLSIDKKEIIFNSELDGVRNVWKIKIKNGVLDNKVIKVSSFISGVYNPVFYDSTTILFSGFENFSFQIYKYKISPSETGKDSIVQMQFDSSGVVWVADKYLGETVKHELTYDKQYTLDYAQSQIVTDPIFGTRGGAVVGLSDLLGDDNYFFLIYNTANAQSEFLKSFNIALQRVNLSKRANFGYGVFHFSGNRYDIRDSDVSFFERSFGASFLLDYPISKFERVEATLTIANSDKEVVSGLIERKALLLSNTIAFVFDNSLWGNTGPLDGMRARFLLGYTTDIKFSNVNYFTIITDLRYYLRLSLRSALAVRAGFFYNEGKEARRYFMGGSWDLRGWPRWSIRGEKMWISSIELRFPLIDQFRIKFPFLDLGLFGIRGALFFDAGNAWDTVYRSTLGSIGGGIRFSLFGGLVLRYDIGKKIENNFRSFQDGLFYQFFFGWDF